MSNTIASQGHCKTHEKFREIDLTQIGLLEMMPSDWEHSHVHTIHIHIHTNAIIPCNLMQYFNDF